MSTIKVPATWIPGTSGTVTTANANVQRIDQNSVTRIDQNGVTRILQPNVITTKNPATWSGGE